MRPDAVSGMGPVSAPDSGNIVGHFLRAQGSRTAVVSIGAGESVSVTLDDRAFVVHGADGIVDSLDVFVPGEQVAVRGERAGNEVAAVEFQSVYTIVSGVYARDGGGHWVIPAIGQRVRIPPSVLQRDAPRGIEPGEALTPTTWTHPTTGEATAVQID